MTDTRIKVWDTARKAIEQAKSWQDLPNGQRYRAQDTFQLSLAHCKPPTLVRYGQKSAGATNYWETGEYFNKAILEYLVADWDNVYPKVLEILEQKENKALQDCQSYINEMQAILNGASK